MIRIARLWVLRSEPEEATKAAKAALEAAQSGKKELAEAEALLGLAGVLKAKKDLAGAQTEAGKAEKLFKKCGHRTGRAGSPDAELVRHGRRGASTGGSSGPGSQGRRQRPSSLLATSSVRPRLSWRPALPAGSMGKWRKLQARLLLPCSSFASLVLRFSK